jgi:spermidine synthase
MLYLDLGRAADAVRHFEVAAAMKPDTAAAYFNLGTALIAAGRIDEAMARYRKALELRPEYGLAHNNLGGVLFRLGRLDEAERHLTDAVRFDPGNADARDNLGRLLAERGRAAQAIEQFREAARLRPDWAAPHAEAAWLLAAAADDRIRNPAEAITLASRAVELTERRDPVALDALAAAYAAAGNFDRAVNTAEAALALTSSDDATRARRDRLALYKEGRVLRLP